MSHAATPWPVLVFWAVVILIARASQAAKKPAPPSGLMVKPPKVDPKRADLLAAMRKLREAERQVAAKPKPNIRLVLEDHSALSQETEPEIVDYDDQALAPSKPSLTLSHSATVPQPAPPPKPGAQLTRYADGSIRGALILSEILGRPKGEN